MINEIVQYENKTLKRINKRKARKQFNYCKKIYTTPKNISINSFWMKPFEIEKYISREEIEDFDKLINEIKYYNCNHEMGYYLKYYIEINYNMEVD